MKCPKCHFDNPSDSKFCKECGTQLLAAEEISVTKTLETPTEELTRGTTIADRYEIIEELGKGGMGKVYRVYDKKIEGEVALKLIKPEIAADKKTIERFRNELKLAREISHRNVCRMYDLNEEKGCHYITMEYVPGEDLKSFIRRAGPLGSGKAIFIAKQVCEGLAEAHRIGVVHRDLKPKNIMIDTKGNARIMDFGIARSLKAKGITGAGVMIGTPEYMSPEQVEGKEVDQSSDIYSLGVILYEMVTGRVPFEGETPLGIAMKHKSEMPKDPREINAQIPEDLSRVILRCMEKDKEQRYQSAGEVRSELKNIEKGIPTTQREAERKKPITSKEITITFGLKKLLIPALVIIVCIILIMILWQPWTKKEVVSIPIDKPSIAIMYFRNNTGDEKLNHWRNALSDLLIADLSQSKYIRVLSGASLFNILSQLNLIEAKNYSSEVLKEVGARGKSNYVLVGDYARAGDNFRINVVLQEAATAEVMGSEIVEGTGEQSFFTMMDELTRRIKGYFHLAAIEIAKDIDEDITKITTSFPEAYEYFSQGSMYYRKADYRRCIESMEKAVAIDPEFAMAYRTMAYAYQTLGYSDERGKYLQKALELKNRISERERYLIEGDFYRQSERTAKLAIEAYTKLLELYPEEWIAKINLGILYHELEQWDKAIGLFEMREQNQTAAYYSSLYQAQSYAALGRYDKAKEVLEYYLSNFSDNSTSHLYLAWNYIYEGEYDLALAEADRAVSLSPTMYHNFLLKGGIYHLKGDLKKSEQEYVKLLQKEEQVAHIYGRSSLAALYLSQGRFADVMNQLIQAVKLAKELGQKSIEFDYLRYLASIYVKSGNSEEAMNIIEEAWQIALERDDLTEQKSVFYDKAVILIEMKSIDESLKVAEELKRMILDSINQKEIRHYYYLIGIIDLEREIFSSAIKNFLEALTMVPSQYAVNNEHALFIDGLASAFYKAGEIDKARIEYKKIISLTISRQYYGDIYAKSFYMLGKINEQQGNKAKAIEHYEKFLTLWKNADPGISEVEDAKKRLAGLQK